ncbi:hypothetical protein [Paenibacillus sp. UMB4589-SE434]|uniref:hypothetical protein n=1 Tax=Paenibacillus sp. UMB4589-SE434 TaxID=3046314 RepID=UPI00254AC0DF|nr:hypothetical protein [Paenibacillus sp. UMB4589-SE434]MDK8180341.1 hypothetical protein [Paenibacillus sp. UMB4589-SE434]
MIKINNSTVPLYVICISVLVLTLMFTIHPQNSTARIVLNYDQNCVEDSLKVAEINAHTLVFCHKRQSNNIYAFTLYENKILSSIIIPQPTQQKMNWNFSRNRMYSVITGEIQDASISKVAIDSIDQSSIIILTMNDDRRIFFTVTDLLHSPVIRGLDFQENVLYSSITAASP